MHECSPDPGICSIEHGGFKGYLNSQVETPPLYLEISSYINLRNDVVPRDNGRIVTENRADKIKSENDIWYVFESVCIFMAAS